MVEVRQDMKLLKISLDGAKRDTVKAKLTFEADFWEEVAAAGVAAIAELEPEPEEANDDDDDPATEPGELARVTA